MMQVSYIQYVGYSPTDALRPTIVWLRKYDTRSTWVSREIFPRFYLTSTVPAFRLDACAARHLNCMTLQPTCAATHIINSPCTSVVYLLHLPHLSCFRTRRRSAPMAANVVSYYDLTCCYHHCPFQLPWIHVSYSILWSFWCMYVELLPPLHIHTWV